jgi:ATP-dependent Clp protease ATP-binding subunit ClpC
MLASTADTVFGLILLGLVVWGVIALFLRGMSAIRRRAAAASPARAESSSSTTRDEAPPPLKIIYGAEVIRARAAARGLRGRLELPDVDALEGQEEFRQAVVALADLVVPVETLVRLARDDDLFVVCIALAALEHRDDVPVEWSDTAIRRLRHASHVEQFFLLRALARLAHRPLIASILSQLDENVPRDWVASFIQQRLAVGEEVDEESFEGRVPIRLIPLIGAFLEEEQNGIPADVREAFEAWQRSVPASDFSQGSDFWQVSDSSQESPVDMDAIRQFARIWDRPYDDPPALLIGRHAELVEFVVDALRSKPPTSLILVGEDGVGKSKVIRAALERLETHWLVFEATAADVHAGAFYVGMLETRVDEIALALRGQKAVWVFPRLDEALYAGQHSRSPQGLLDALLPHVESGDLTIIGEVSTSAYAQLIRERPRVASVFNAQRLRPLDEHESIAVARHALDHGGLGVTASDDVLAESFDLAQQFLPAIAAPGNLVPLVLAAAADLAERGGHVVEAADVIGTLARASGLPLVLLDPAARLDLNEVRVFFEKRVLGQPEAVDLLVERIMMIKAGLTDATRPLGVFLFVGPTGTGKTELAKTLAQYVFGSPERLIRLDMSEFQTPDSLERLLTDPGPGGHGSPLLTSVRKDPFAVVLLDEFEKAAAPIWDLFLQVFDDGRLTDLRGRTADFRRCVIILTSNVGSSITAATGLGFGSEAQPFRPQAVERAVRQSFRPEFLNRIDRIVVFQPFEPEQMRLLLEKQLAEVVQRRGLRGRPWAIEYDESALVFLLEQGFTRDQGARPLQRAIERHLLTPLAQAIVEQRVPEGEQFLFVSAPKGRRIEVTFVDPDGPEHARDSAVSDSITSGEGLDLRALVLAPRGDRRAADFLVYELLRIAAAARGDAVQGRKDAALAAMTGPGFWEDDDRFAVLGDVEYLDRLQAALRTAEKLGERLRRHLAQHQDSASRLIELLAMRLYVLDRALAGLADGIPGDVFLRIRPAAGTRPTEASSFTTQLADMYEAWGERRGMRSQRLEGLPQPAEHVFAIAGLGAGTILANEVGLHVLELIVELNGGGRTVNRVSATVQLAPWAGGLDQDGVSLENLAETALGTQAPNQRVVRRYRPHPSPLVRDSVRRYRTGRLDRVLAGDFDLF